MQSGRVGIIPRPRGGDWLDDEARAWRGAGIDVVVSLLTPEEISEFQLEDEGRYCRAEGIQFLSFPIPDRGAPPSRQAAVALVDKLVKMLESGKNVAIHCRQGIGRSALIAASLLVSLGGSADDAFRAVGKARGCAVPDTMDQRIWVDELAVDGLLSK